MTQATDVGGQRRKKRLAVFVVLGLALTILSLAALRCAAVFSSNTLAASTPKDYPLCPDARDLRVDKTTKILLRSYCLTGRITLPVGYNFKIEAADNGEIELFFWNGQRFLVKEKESVWLGDIPHNIFRLRGKTGIATITLEKIN